LTHRQAEDLDRQLDRIVSGLPPGAGRWVRWLMEPSSRWVRLPAGLLLIVAGLVGFLPILGFWMVPLGLILLSQDIPFLRRPTYRALLWLEERWERWKRRVRS
jgi:hypothetical protein